MDEFGNTQKVQQQREHDSLHQMIDAAYAYAAAGKADIFTWYQQSRGPLAVAFLDFYKHFELLYDLTHLHENMASEKELLEEMKKWFLDKHIDKQNNIDPKTVFRGIDLFDMYRLQLIKSGIISWNA